MRQLGVVVGVEVKLVEFRAGLDIGVRADPRAQFLAVRMAAPKPTLWINVVARMLRQLAGRGLMNFEVKVIARIRQTGSVFASAVDDIADMDLVSATTEARRGGAVRRPVQQIDYVAAECPNAEIAQVAPKSEA